jgi:hypothetical protein
VLLRRVETVGSQTINDAAPDVFGRRHQIFLGSFAEHRMDGGRQTDVQRDREARRGVSCLSAYLMAQSAYRRIRVAVMQTQSLHSQAQFR